MERPGGTIATATAMAVKTAIGMATVEAPAGLRRGPVRPPARLAGDAPLSGLAARFEESAFVYADLSVLGRIARDTHWYGLAATLAEQGAPGSAIATLADRYLRAPTAPALLAAFAAADGTLVYEQVLTETPVEPLAGFAAPPPLRPLLRWRQERPPYVLVVIDRRGADLTASTGAGSRERSWSVTGPDDEVVHHSLGGWAALAQSRFQRRAADSWRHNAKSVAREVVTALDDVAATVLVVSGDVRAVQLLQTQLPDRPGLLVRRIHGARMFDGSQPQRLRHVADELRDAAAEQTRALVGTFVEQLAPGGRGVRGLPATVAALANRRVETLLVSDEPATHRMCFGRRATDVFADRAAALESGTPLRRGPAPDVLVRAALLGGANVRIVPAALAGPLADALADGVGAICRYAPG